MATPALTAESLCVDRGGHRVLENVSFDVAAGEVFALLGGNGAGKSTTLLTFLGFVQAASGLVKVNGLNVFDDVEAVHQQAAYLPESANLYPHLSAIENLEYFLSLARVSCSMPEINQALDVVNLQTAARGKSLGSYSKGMRQKVAIALAILRKTPVLLLDEPTSGLDPVAIDEFNSILIQLAASGKTVLMVTHDVYGACHVAKRVGLLQKGQMVGLFEAPASGEISAEEVHRAFAEHHGV